jgi:hypothetical protein
MLRMTLWSTHTLFTLLMCLLVAPPTAIADADVFRTFTTHIARQVQADKQTFVAAQTCTVWFYQQLQKKAPPQPSMQDISLSMESTAERRTDEASHCLTRYPDGLDEARKDFSSTQSSLSISLTFYEYALVGDRNDDARYNDVELQDMLESFGLRFNEALPSSAHLFELRGQFESIRRSSGLDVLMSGMGYLYDRGYRFTPHDRDALNRLSG